MRFKLVTILVLCLAAAATLPLSGCSKSGSESGASKAQRYHCPMHPTYISDGPGDCPICNMKLVPIKDTAPAKKPMAAASDEETAHIKPGQYYCPMDTEIVRDEPGTCPECNMKLIQKKDPATTPGQGGHEMHAEAAPVPGRISISVSPEKRQLIGLTLAKVENRDLSRTIRTAALVEHDETRYTAIAPRFAGWIRKLHVDFTGAPVEKGQPLFTVYSPELFAAENEYLVAWRAAQQMNQAGAGQNGATNSLLDSARLRLSLFQIGEEEVAELEKHGKPGAELLFRAPFSGHVIVKNAVEGAAFEAGETLFEISDLSHVWLRAYVFEYELPQVSVGQEATIHFPNLNNASFESQVSFIYPHIDPQTRRGQVRLELDNPEHLVRPDMWATVQIKIEAGNKLSVPASALINTGERFIAFVESAEHHLEPREVKVGLKTDDFYEVLSGLKDGEQVVARALFLVDSESQLKSAIAGLTSSSTHQH